MSIKQSSNLTKNQLRKQFKVKRNNYNSSLLIDYNNKIFDKVISFIRKHSCKNIFIYVSKNNEVDTKKIIRYLLNNKYNVIVPKSDFNNNEIIPVQINSLKDLKESKFGLLEPVNDNMFEPDNLDVIFIPGIVFDKSGYRIGYGKGFFDRFLNNSVNKLKIGLAYSFQILKNIPADKYDIKLDGIICENGLIYAHRI